MTNSEQSATLSQPTDAQEKAEIEIDAKNSAEKPSRLMTFKTPTPSRRLIKMLVPVNRWLFLGGIPGLRSLPFLGRVPGIRGLTDIPKIDFPKAEEQRLADAVSSKNACFMVPNHPEFFTDWMLDKEIMTRVSPRAASWATHDIVNGMGEGAQKFWLKNNLIAQIPGAGGAAGKAYSVDWALAGNGVLLHPEGAVGWHADLIGHIYPGAIDMAIKAAKRAGKDRRVLVAPIIWKLKFKHDVASGLHKELDYVEKSLQLPQTSHSDDLAQRLYDAYSAILARDEDRYGVKPTDAHFFERQDNLIAKLLPMLGEHLDRVGADPESSTVTTDLIRRGERWARTADRKSDDAKPINKLTKDLRQLLRFSENFYTGTHIRQEHIAEGIKRIRSDYCKGTLRDTINSFIPQPVGPRTAYIRIPEPVEISHNTKPASVPKLLEELRSRMQATLDEINSDLDAKYEIIEYRNVFLR